MLGTHTHTGTGPGKGEDKDAGTSPGPFLSSPHTDTKESGIQPQQGRQDSPTSKFTGRFQNGKRSRSSRQLRAALPRQVLTPDRDQVRKSSTAALFQDGAACRPGRATSTRFKQSNPASLSRVTPHAMLRAGTAAACHSQNAKRIFQRLFCDHRECN